MLLCYMWITHRRMTIIGPQITDTLLVLDLLDGVISGG